MAGDTLNHHLGDLMLEALEVFVCIVKNSMKGNLENQTLHQWLVVLLKWKGQYSDEQYMNLCLDVWLVVLRV